ncbi:GNAT family N-acetyltransferase [Alphaproteobacteria bacterium GH1-50]|uniref:GNAT family N-acetyltransferase n=1 Tax=Kangsaoukella pontilimi TaxID=2691042 RepID=A0A7C9IFP6_9RHOB|nr:GNAT family N-acetyltransferase [Kangsaoukella pontilimi]MXQ07708.1 GNAT family N-acetyltransferase [Kangsaoukella pontilimi]
MPDATIEKVRSAPQIGDATAMVWEFFDLLKDRYPDMVTEIDEYIASQGVAGELENFREYFNPPKGEAFLGRLDGQPAGIVMLKPHGENDGELNRMFVREAARGTGLGRKLAQAVIDEARALGYRTVYLDALYRHVEALPLYESLGFEYYTDPTAFRADDSRVIHMKLAL